MGSTDEIQVVSSCWRIALPLKEYVKDRVTVYFYSDKWVPIKYCFLEKAILLYHQSKSVGKEILLFPADLDPNNF